MTLLLYVYAWAVPVGVIIVLSLVYYVTAKPLSYPGDARKNRLLAKGRWRDRATSCAKGWKFAVAEKSHEISTRCTGVPLTGKPTGRQIWYKDDSDSTAEQSPEVMFNPSFNPNAADIPLRTILTEQWQGVRPDSTLSPSTAKDAARKGMSYFQMLQCSDGHWAGDYCGPMFLTPGLVIVIYLTKIEFEQYRKDALISYIRNHQQVDGGWGLHVEGPSTMFGSVLNYVAIRLLGVSADDRTSIEAREFIHKHGGALYTSSWAKFWLAVLGVYDWSGLNSIPCEMWFLPRWFPFHPGKLWCHCRMVYLPMCYVYGRRFSADVASDPLLQQLRKEIYCEPYESINWDAHRFSIAEIDNYSPIHWVMRLACNILSYYEPRPLMWLRNKGLEFAIQYIMEEDKQTNYVDIGPVNKSLNMLAVWVHSGCDNTAERFRPHIPRIYDYLWLAEDGLRMAGYNGSQCWDTSFTAQAIVESQLASEFKECSVKIYKYLDATQVEVDEENRSYWFRQQSKGAWPFSTSAHGWPISDCTAEGLKGVLALSQQPCVRDAVPLIPAERLFDAVECLLDLHNPDGGWATYENNRGYGWYELLNPSEVFGDIMIDYSYVECTSACVTALSKFTKLYPSYKPVKIQRAIQRARLFFKSIQRPDGSWYGSWGVCFTYGTWFGIEGLVAAGEPTNSPAIRKALSFLLSKQNENGGWGEDFVSCADKAYPEGSAERFGHDGSGVVQTAWALLALMAGSSKDRNAIDRGIVYLMHEQLPDGDWPQAGILGVFNRSCGITYSQYRNIFPIWALGRYASLYEL